MQIRIVPNRGRVRQIPIAVIALASFAGCAARGTQPGEPSRAARAPDVVFVPTPFSVVDRMLAVARVQRGDVLYDLGSGDGRIVVAAAKRFGIRAVGIDIDQRMIDASRRNADTAGVRDLVEFRNADLFETDLRAASVVTLYLLPSLNLRLRPKLFAELRPGARVVSHAFDMGDWKADSTLTVDARVVYYWRMPADVSGRWTIATDDGGIRGHSEIRFVQKYQRIESADAGGGLIVANAMVTGDSIRFDLRRENAGDPVATAYRGRVSGRSMSGTFTAGGSTGSWRATREENPAIH